MQIRARWLWLWTVSLMSVGGLPAPCRRKRRRRGDRARSLSAQRRPTFAFKLVSTLEKKAAPPTCWS